MKLIMDFYEDRGNHLRPTLLPPNFRMVPGTDPDEIMIRFLNWFRRQIGYKKTHPSLCEMISRLPQLIPISCFWGSIQSGGCNV